MLKLEKNGRSWDAAGTGCSKPSSAFRSDAFMMKFVSLLALQEAGMIVHSYRPVQGHLGSHCFGRMHLFPIGEFLGGWADPHVCAKCVPDQCRQLGKRTRRVLTSQYTYFENWRVGGRAAAVSADLGRLTWMGCAESSCGRGLDPKEVRF